MKANDAITGGIFLAFAIFAFAYAGTFTPLPGIKYGPDLFPRVVATIMGLAGLAMIIGALRPVGRQPLFVIAGWARKPRSHLLIAAVLLSILFYILASAQLGFLLTGFLMLGGLLGATRGPSKLLSSAVTALAVSIIIYLLFVRLLRVPLPMGLIENLLLVR